METLQNLVKMPLHICYDIRDLKRVAIKDNVVNYNGTTYYPVDTDHSIKPLDPYEIADRYGKVRTYEDGEYYVRLTMIDHSITSEGVTKCSIKPKRRDFGRGIGSEERYKKALKDWENYIFQSQGWAEFSETWPNQFPGFTVIKRIGDESFTPEVKEVYLGRYYFNIYHNEWPERSTVFEFYNHYDLSHYIPDMVMNHFEKQYCPWFAMNYEFQNYVDENAKEFMNNHFYNLNNWNLYDEDEYEYATSKPYLNDMINEEIHRIWNSYTGLKYCY